MGLLSFRIGAKGVGLGSLGSNMQLLHGSIGGLLDVGWQACRYAAVQKIHEGDPMTEQTKTEAELALDALNQAFEYYTPTPVEVSDEADFVEYYEYAAAA